ncbi:MAG: VanZ family protein [Eubacterium sp.]|jgi:VanZ family protein|nr:VanZ family protein [Eubacterium sp.]
MKKVVGVLSWAAVFLWMLLIFKLSSQAAVQSNGLSLGITYWLQKIMEKIINMEVSGFNHIVRKGAHFTAYLILGILSSNALRISGISKGKRFVLALGICVLYAISDEIHQLFIAGRSGQATDVMLDSLGAATGLGIFMLMENRLKKRNLKKVT